MLDIFYSDLISERKKYFQKTCLTFQKIQKQIAVPLREKKKKKKLSQSFAGKHLLNMYQCLGFSSV